MPKSRIKTGLALLDGFFFRVTYAMSLEIIITNIMGDVISGDEHIEECPVRLYYAHTSVHDDGLCLHF